MVPDVTRYEHQSKTDCTVEGKSLHPHGFVNGWNENVIVLNK